MTYNIIKINNKNILPILHIFYDITKSLLIYYFFKI